MKLLQGFKVSPFFSKICIFVILIIFFTLTFTPKLGYAQNCGAAGKEIRAVQSNAFDDYPALNDLKQGLLLMLYGRGSANCPKELYAFALEGKEFLILFDKAYHLSLSNNTDDRFAALELAKTLNKKIKTLHDYQKMSASALDVVASARNAYIDFLKTQGEINEREGGLSNRTRDKIAHYRIATLAYEAADENILAANTRIKWKTLEEKYNQDMSKAGNLQSQADELMENAQTLSGSIPMKIEAYVDTMEALELYRASLSYYIYHNEDEKIAETQRKISYAENVMNSLKEVLILYFIVLTVVLIGIALFLLNRLMAWREDTYEYYLGNELIKVKWVE